MARARLFTEVPGGRLRHMASAETKEVQAGDQEQPFLHEDSLAVGQVAQSHCAIAMPGGFQAPAGQSTEHLV